METTYNDLAIVLAWPDTTIRGDEPWMMVFRKLGIVKNLNFKVGHTGVILIDNHDQSLLYYDFGRYITPRGLGRARSPLSDPRLKMRTKAEIGDREKGVINNIKEIAEELASMPEATQGYGRMYFSVATGINFNLAKQYADELVLEGSTPYGAFAKGNNNCSRFITRLLMRASKRYNYWHGINLPETFKSSPLSNVVNVRPDRKIFLHHPETGLQTIYMSRWQSFAFIIKQLRDNFSRKSAQFLPNDQIIGSMKHKERPDNLPEHAQWLGGIGEGAWYVIEPTVEPKESEQLVEGKYAIEVSRYTEYGELEYRLPFYTNEDFDAKKPFRIAYDSHMIATNVMQNGRIIRFYSSVFKSLQPIGIVNFKPANRSVAALGLVAKD